MSRPRREAWSFLCVRMCSCSSLIRAVSKAICTSGDPVSLGSRRNLSMICVLWSLVIAIGFLTASDFHVSCCTCENFSTFYPSILSACREIARGPLLDFAPAVRSGLLTSNVVEVLEVGLDVLAHRQLRRACIAGLHRGEDARVVAKRDLGAVAPECLPAALDQQFLDGGQHDLKQRIPGRAGQYRMEVEVCPDVRLQGAARVAQDLLRGAEGVEVRLGPARGRERRDGRLQRQADRGEVLDAQVRAAEESLVADG